MEDERVVNTAQSIMKTSLPSIDSIYTSCCFGKATKIIKDPYPGYTLFHVLPLVGRHNAHAVPILNITVKYATISAPRNFKPSLRKGHRTRNINSDLFFTDAAR
eukprot:g40537.t1